MAAKQGLFVGVAAAVAVTAAAIAASGHMPGGSGVAGGRMLRTAATTTLFAPPAGAPMSFADIFDKVSPAVVSIDVSSKIDASQLNQFPFGLFGNGQGANGGGNGSGQGANGNGARRGGGRGGANGPNANGDDGDATGPAAKRLGAGSGFVISADGYILTNNHVVADADDIEVTFTDGRKLKAKVVGTDEFTDLAVIKVSGSSFQYVNFEDQTKPRVGDWVMAVGNPFKLGGSVTAGIVSAFGRNGLGGENGQDDPTNSYVDYIQIDAPINMGNSGGPTFDTYGRVIGVNSAIYSPTGGSVGIGFAIPADIAESVSKQLIASGKVVRGYIGATVSPFTADDAAALGLGNQLGALVASTVCAGPAAKGGLQIKDIVTAVNRTPIKSSTDLTREVAKVQPGGQIRLDIIRDGAKRSIALVSGTRPQTQAQLTQASDDDTCSATVKAASVTGAATASADDGRILGMALSANDDGPGVTVDAIRANSDAYDKGITKGLVITDINLKAVNKPSDVADAVAAAKKAGRTTVLLGLSGGGRVPVNVN